MILRSQRRPASRPAGRERGFSFAWRADPDDLNEVFRLPPRLNPRQRRVAAAMFVEGALEATGEHLRQSYSRSAGWYVGRGLHPDFGSRSVAAAMDGLVLAGAFLDHQVAAPGALGWQSSALAAPFLADIMLPPIWLDPNPLVRWPLRPRAERRLPEEFVPGERRIISELNEAIGASSLVVDAPDVVADGHVLRCGNRYVLYPLMTSAYAVYNGPRLGGRLFGLWPQNATKLHRTSLRLNGEPVVEIDYRELHPRLLHAECGGIVEGDAYEVPGFPRPLVKVAVNVLLNAGSYSEAVGAIAHERHRRTGELLLAGDASAAQTLIEAIKFTHERVARHFHTGVGLRLQFVESTVAKRVLARLLGLGVVVIPVHDSFIVAEKHAGILEQIMVEELERAGVPVARYSSITSISAAPQRGVGRGGRGSSDGADGPAAATLASTWPGRPLLLSESELARVIAGEGLPPASATGGPLRCRVSPSSILPALVWVLALVLAGICRRRGSVEARTHMRPLDAVALLVRQLVAFARQRGPPLAIGRSHRLTLPEHRRDSP